MNNQTDSTEFYKRLTEGGKSIFVIKRELAESNWSEIEQVGREILQSVEKSSAPQVMLDLSELEYMGSAMVALLLRIWKQVNAQKGKMVFVNQEQGVYEVLKLAGLTKLWTICETREEAATHLGTTLEQTGRSLSPLLLVGALIAAAIGLGSYLILHRATAPTDIAILGKLQIAGSIVALVLSLWILKASTGKARATGFLLCLTALVVLLLGFLDVRIPGLAEPDAVELPPEHSAGQVELGESVDSEPSDELPPGLLDEEPEQEEIRPPGQDANTVQPGDEQPGEPDPSSSNPSNAPRDDDSSDSSPDTNTEQGTP
jgi:anti-anti-sigma factor